MKCPIRVKKWSDLIPGADQNIFHGQKEYFDSQYDLHCQMFNSACGAFGEEFLFFNINTRMLVIVSDMKKELLGQTVIMFLNDLVDDGMDYYGHATIYIHESVKNPDEMKRKIESILSLKAFL